MNRCSTLGIRLTGINRITVDRKLSEEVSKDTDGLDVGIMGDDMQQCVSFMICPGIESGLTFEQKANSIVHVPEYAAEQRCPVPLVGQVDTSTALVEKNGSIRKHAALGR